MIPKIIIYCCILIFVGFFAWIYRSREHKDTFENVTPKLIISMTTSPSRIHKLQPVIDSIMNQTSDFDYLQLNLPKKFGRTGETYTIPSYLQNNPKIVIHQPEMDYGPITKIKGSIDTLNSDSDTWIIYLDDDIKYPPNMISYYKKYAQKYGKQCAYAPCGFNYNPIKIFDWGTYGFINIPEGYGSVCIHRSHIKDDFENYVQTSIRNNDCKFSDDILMGMYLTKHNIPVKQIYEDDFNDKYILKKCVLSYGNEGDALHNQGSQNEGDNGHKEKYRRCVAFLQN